MRTALATTPSRPPSRRRQAGLDTVKVALTAGVIVVHAAITYGADGSWFYREPTLGTALRVALDVPVALGSMFAMGTFFFLAGLVVPTSLARRGRGGFLAARWRRLGVPLALFVLAVVPLVQWRVAAATGTRVSAAQVWRDQLGDLDPGPLWFVGVLLLFSTGYAAVARPPAPAYRPSALRARTLVGTAAGVAGTTFLLRLAFPVDSYQPLGAHIWQWGQCAGLFALGTAAGRHGWVEHELPRRLRRGCHRVLALGAAAVLGVLAGASGPGALEPYGGGLHWQAGLTAALEGAVSVSATVVLVAAAGRSRGRLGSALGRDAYPAYLLQTPVLVALALLLRPVPVPPAAKLLLLASTAVTASFAAAAVARHAVMAGPRGGRQPCRSSASP